MRVVVLAVALLLLGCQANRSDDSVTVFAAASLTDVMEAFADTFQAATDHQIVLNLAGSSLLARQLSMGATADLFVSAHPTWTEYLRDRGSLAAVDTLPISNNLVLVSKSGTDIFSADRIAMADPEHVPAGIYARAALRCEGWWEELEDEIVPTLDVRAALEAVSEGAAEAGIVYGSDAMLAPELVTRDIFTEACRPVVTYTAGITHESSVGGKRFAALLQDSSMIPLWNRFGFSDLEAEATRVPAPSEPPRAED